MRVDVEYATLILNILCLDGMGKVGSQAGEGRCECVMDSVASVVGGGDRTCFVSCWIAATSFEVFS